MATEEYRVLVCGDRRWARVMPGEEEDPVAIERAKRQRKTMIGRLATLEHEARGRGVKLVIIEGEALGADRLSRELAESWGVEVRRFPANWKRWGKTAGPRRNAQMLEEGDPHLVMAFHENLSESSGTRDMVMQASMARVPVIVAER